MSSWQVARFAQMLTPKRLIFSRKGFDSYPEALPWAQSILRLAAS
jgi:hypothetical protein